MTDDLKRLLYDPRLPTRLFVVACLIGGTLLLTMHHDIGFFGDDWNVLLERQGWGIKELLGDHNAPHPYVSDTDLQGLLAAFGAGAIWPYYVLAVGLQILVAALIFVWIKARTDAWLALFVGTVVLMFGAGWENIFWTIQICFLGSLAAGIGDVDAVRRRRHAAQPRLVHGAVVRVDALGRHGVIFLFAIAYALVLALRRRRALSVIALPALFFVVWYLIDQPRQDLARDDGAAPKFFHDLMVNAFGGIFGFDGAWGRAIAVLAAVGLYKLFTRENGVRPVLLMLLTLPVAFWALTALKRAGLSEVIYPTPYTYMDPCSSSLLPPKALGPGGSIAERTSRWPLSLYWRLDERDAAAPRGRHDAPLQQDVPR